MINSYKQRDNHRAKSKSIYHGNKSHTASMNLRITPELVETYNLRNITNRLNEERGEEDRSRSAKKHKHSIVIQDNTISLFKKTYEPTHSHSKAKNYYDNRVLETDRISKQKVKIKRSIDNTTLRRLKTDVNEDRNEENGKMLNVIRNGSYLQKETVQISKQELSNLIQKIKNLKTKKEQLSKEVGFYKRQMKKGANSSALKALRE